jgi:hypothetical protein
VATTGVYSRVIVGRETSTIKDAAFVEYCLRMALWRRQHTGRPVPEGLIHHSDYAEKSVKPSDELLIAAFRGKGIDSSAERSGSLSSQM